MRRLAVLGGALFLACAMAPKATVVYLAISEGRTDSAQIVDSVAKVADTWNLAAVPAGALAERAWVRGPSRFRGDLYILVDVAPKTESVFIELALEPETDADSTYFRELCAELEGQLESLFPGRLVRKQSRRPFPEEGRALQRW